MVLKANLASREQIRNSVACWLFNPFTVTISTRGSGEALVTVQMLLMLNCLLQGMYSLAVRLSSIWSSETYGSVHAAAASSTCLPGCIFKMPGIQQPTAAIA